MEDIRTLIRSIQHGDDISQERIDCAINRLSGHDEYKKWLRESVVMLAQRVIGGEITRYETLSEEIDVHVCKSWDTLPNQLYVLSVASNPLEAEAEGWLTAKDSLLKRIQLCSFYAAMQDLLREWASSFRAPEDEEDILETMARFCGEPGDFRAYFTCNAVQYYGVGATKEIATASLRANYSRRTSQTGAAK